MSSEESQAMPKWQRMPLLSIAEQRWALSPSLLMLPASSVVSLSAVCARG